MTQFPSKSIPIVFLETFLEFLRVTKILGIPWLNVSQLGGQPEGFPSRSTRCGDAPNSENELSWAVRGP